MNSSLSTLVLGAFEGEIDLLLPLENSQLTVRPIGVGNLNAGIGLERLLTSWDKSQKPFPSVIFFLGSAGRFFTAKENKNSPDSLFSISLAQGADLWEPSVENNNSRIPEILAKTLSFGELKEHQDILTMFSKLKELPSSWVYCPTGISIADIPPPHSHEKEHSALWALENLEVFGLSQVLQDRKIPFFPLLTITNPVGKNGSDLWKKNWRQASTELQNFFMKILREKGIVS